MKRFEYKTLKIKATGFWGTKFSEEDIDDQLNELGNQGWELVSVQHGGYSGNTYELFYTLKREK